jgi:transcriptional regulator with XRE-family HTH domain
MAARIPPSSTDLAATQRLLEIALDLADDRKGELARVIGVDPSAVTRYLSGERQIELHVLLGALRTLLRRKPHRTAEVVQEVADRFLDQQGEWKAVEAPKDLGDVATESMDVTIAQGELLRAAQSGDADRIARAVQRLQQETRELAAVALGGQA